MEIFFSSICLSYFSVNGYNICWFQGRIKKINLLLSGKNLCPVTKTSTEKELVQEVYSLFFSPQNLTLDPVRDQKAFKHKGTLIQCTNIIHDDGYPSAKGNQYKHILYFLSSHLDFTQPNPHPVLIRSFLPVFHKWISRITLL